MSKSTRDLLIALVTIAIIGVVSVALHFTGIPMFKAIVASSLMSIAMDVAVLRLRG
jgi:Na+-translocating ferredoxin:NAD+ oxidoreductase RnfD subunit